MRLTLVSPSSFARKALWIPVLTALAVIADWFAPPIFGNHTLVLGLVFYWIALRYFDSRSALLILVTGTATLTYKWGQPYSPAVIALEGFVVGAFWRREKNPLVTDLLFWALIGIPLTWFIHTYVSPLPHPVFDQILVIQPINGFVALWITYIIVELLPPAPRGAGFIPAQTFNSFLFKRYVALGTFPVLVAGLLAARSLEKRVMDDAEANLTASAQILAANVSRHISHCSSIVEKIAQRQTNKTWFTDAPRLSAELRAAHKNSGVFVTMLAADAQGVIIASAKNTAGTPPAPTTPMMSITDRSYFRVPMESGQPYVSEVFRGRGFGRDLIVAISTPVISHAGEKLGIIEGSINVEDLTRFLRQKNPGGSSHAFVSDSAQVIIAATDHQHPALTDLTGRALGPAVAQRDSIPRRVTDDLVGDDTSFMSISVPIPETTWTITLQRPWADVVSPVVTAYTWTLSVAAGAAALAAAFAAWSIRPLLKTWRELMLFVRAPDARLERLAPSVHAELPQEFSELITKLAAMARRLESERSQREELLVQLETRVQERTQQLRDLLAQTEGDARLKADLLREVNHRVTNNLTSVLGLLAFEAQSATQEHSPAVTAVLRRLSERIRSLLEVHRMMAHAGWIPVQVDRLATQVIRAALAAAAWPRPPLVDIAPHPLRVSPRQASSLALLLSELTTNTIKYAGHPDRPVEITFASTLADDGSVILRYHDNGPGYPPEVLTQQRSNIGLKLIREIVATTLRGTVEFTNDHGATVIIQMRAEEETRT